jgi:alkanesulfonate monooxygenase SsuD/methylene tetrahydromethanopterin reductase-like flavin-dependent oxidoreductase (luciferase family)
MNLVDPHPKDGSSVPAADRSPAMGFAIFSHLAHKRTMTIHERLREFVAEVRLADELGFDYFFTAEHHFSREFCLSVSQPVTLTTIAQNTERIRFGPMAIILPLSEPVRVAEEMLILDHMSNGRLEIGLTRGIEPNELVGYGVRYEESADRFREALAFLTDAWTRDKTFSFLGQYSKYFDIDLGWQPLQRPHPPLWCPTSSPVSAREWGERGYGIAGFSPLGLDLHREVFDAYREGCDSGGRSPAERRIAYSVACVVAETDDEARRLATEHYGHSMDLFKYVAQRSASFAPPGTSKLYERQLRLFEKLKDPSEFDALLSCVHGAPETVTAKLNHLQAELGINTVFCEFSFGLLPWVAVEQSLSLFKEGVMPNFARTATPGMAVATD